MRQKLMKKIDKEKIKTWFITGASSGIGYKLCIELLNRGYNVIAVSRRVPNINHDNALCLSVDVTKSDTIKTAIEEGIKRFEKIDVLSNNAGISANITCEEETIEHMKQVMDTNFWGTFNTINAILPHFRQNKNGTIINNTSQSGLTPRLNGSAYVSSKHAIEGLTGVCKLETIKFCRVMSIEFGFFSGTNVINRMLNIPTDIAEYQHNKEFCKIWNNYYNDLDKAIPIIIKTVENLILPRHLILGRDACKKVKTLMKELKRDLALGEYNTTKCSKYNYEFIKKVIHKIYKIIFRKHIKENIDNDL